MCTKASIQFSDNWLENENSEEKLELYYTWLIHDNFWFEILGTGLIVQDYNYSKPETNKNETKLVWKHEKKQI